MSLFPPLNFELWCEPASAFFLLLALSRSVLSDDDDWWMVLVLCPVPLLCPHHAHFSLRRTMLIVRNWECDCSYYITSPFFLLLALLRYEMCIALLLIASRQRQAGAQLNSRTFSSNWPPDWPCSSLASKILSRLWRVSSDGYDIKVWSDVMVCKWVSTLWMGNFGGESVGTMLSTASSETLSRKEVRERGAHHTKKHPRIPLAIQPKLCASSRRDGLAAWHLPAPTFQPPLFRLRRDNRLLSSPIVFISPNEFFWWPAFLKVVIKGRRGENHMNSHSYLLRFSTKIQFSPEVISCMRLEKIIVSLPFLDFWRKKKLNFIIIFSSGSAYGSLVPFKKYLWLFILCEMFRHFVGEEESCWRRYASKLLSPLVVHTNANEKWTE